MTIATEKLIDYECVDQVATIRLNRPEKLNAFSDELVLALVDALRRFDGDPNANVAVLAGNGRAFSSGADVNQRQLRTREELTLLGGPEGFGAKGADIFTRAVNWKPVISAVHGYAIGMAVGVAFSAELVVAEEGTQFQVTETPRGLSGVRYASLMRLRGIGSFALEATLTGSFFSAEQAFAAGLINRVAPRGAYLTTAFELARGIAQMPPLSVRAMVRAHRLAIEKAEREAAILTDPLKLHLTEDFAESARAFVEKRPKRPMQGR
ncbi:enoyl-CoA hydratase/isomerase family protein [Noviherbaspirillum sp. Root189]|uniref:enoyl-CoA hydratase/isomerase family protein n=1 Tax=Noviherbaspirillum sp. Root189 TaxID=1736487 RepID=UPI00070E9FF9|nr:enoyl-CoA hydratase/isomerase family protein [Noviherbaspirillum sp. Root189]KRB74229.1 hypothetical protein ASE07_26625 [Noviherbaspirillum sp. Root189]